MFAENNYESTWNIQQAVYRQHSILCAVNESLRAHQAARSHSAQCARVLKIRLRLYGRMGVCTYLYLCVILSVIGCVYQLCVVCPQRWVRLRQITLMIINLHRKFTDVYCLISCILFICTTYCLVICYCLLRTYSIILTHDNQIVFAVLYSQLYRPQSELYSLRPLGNV